jgi:hypothetical protein
VKVLWCPLPLDLTGVLLLCFKERKKERTKSSSILLRTLSVNISYTLFLTSLKKTRKPNSDHLIQQPHWPEKNNLQAYTQPYSAEHFEKEK